MDLLLFIEIIVALAAIYFVIKFIVSPIIKAVAGIVILLILIYLLQKFFGFDFGQMLAPLGINITDFINNLIDEGKNLLNFFSQKIPQSINK